MRIGAALSTDPDPATAAEAAVQGARSQIGGAEVSLAVVVASRQHAPSAEIALETVRIKAGPERVIGCVAETVVSGDREVEDGPAVAVWLACLPEPVETFHMEFVRTSEGDVLGGYRFEEAGPGPYLLIGDPFSFPTDLLLGHLNERVPGTVLMGGMASGGMRSGDTRLFLDDRVVDTGAIGARLPGIAIRALVSQGCRPIGNVYAVTRAEGNVIHELGGRPPLQRLQELVATLPSEDRELVGRGLHVGRVIDEDCRFPCPSPFPGKTRRKRSCAAAAMRPFTGGLDGWLVMRRASPFQTLLGRQLRGELHARGLRALRPASRLELDLLALVEVLVSLACNGAEVHEHVGAAIVRGDEAVALFGAEPLDGAGRHAQSPPLLAVGAFLLLVGRSAKCRGGNCSKRTAIGALNSTIYQYR